MKLTINDIQQFVFGGRFVGPPYPIGASEGRLQVLNPGNKLPLKSLQPIRNQFTQTENGYEFKMPVRFRKAKDDNSGYHELILPNEPFISIYGAKDVTKTTINRGKKRGTVREERNLDDYRIRIRGVAVNLENEDDLPETQIRAIRTFFESPGAVEIENAYTSLYNIKQVTIMRLVDRPVERLNINVRAYELECESDEDFELEL